MNVFNDQTHQRERTGPSRESRLNPYAAIITSEAHRRGIAVEVLDVEAGYFSLSHAGQAIICRESLTERTNAIAMSRCDDKAVTRRLLARAGLRVPTQMTVTNSEENEAFLKRHEHIVVKPAHGEQGAGISVDITNMEDLTGAIESARRVSEPVLLEEYIDGEDLRVIVIDFKVVAAAVRRPPRIVGTGEQTILELVKTQSRRREEATGGESHIPLDEETRRCIKESGFSLSDVLERGRELIVRKTDNVHTGATIEDVTPQLHPKAGEAAIEAARAINIPVVGIDFIMPALDRSEYVIIEANERPGLANHEPQPTAQRFIDYLFPETASET
jgi:GNAT-family acetyltransferase (TIGR03103 family)